MEYPAKKYCDTSTEIIPREEASKTIEQDFSISCAAFEKKKWFCIYTVRWKIILSTKDKIFFKFKEILIVPRNFVMLKTISASQNPPSRHVILRISKLSSSLYQHIF